MAVVLLASFPTARTKRYSLLGRPEIVTEGGWLIFEPEYCGVPASWRAFVSVNSQKEAQASVMALTNVTVTVPPEARLEAAFTPQIDTVQPSAAAPVGE